MIAIFIVLVIIAATLVIIARHLGIQNRIQIEVVNKLEEIVEASKKNDQN